MVPRPQNPTTVSYQDPRYWPTCTTTLSLRGVSPKDFSLAMRRGAGGQREREPIAHAGYAVDTQSTYVDGPAAGKNPYNGSTRSTSSAARRTHTLTDARDACPSCSRYVAAQIQHAGGYRGVGLPAPATYLILEDPEYEEESEPLILLASQSSL
jgi:hypothetical protein